MTNMSSKLKGHELLLPNDETHAVFFLNTSSLKTERESGPNIATFHMTLCFPFAYIVRYYAPFFKARRKREVLY
jgi:hypothetical protein